MERLLVVGLGNPGSRYAGTRHNVGFAVVHRLVDRLRARPLERTPEYESWEADPPGVGPGLVLVIPLTLMNRSGMALLALRERGGEIDPARCLAVVDDVHLPLGTLRLRGRGGDGGHNGLESLRLVLGTEAYPRLRIGVGRDAAAHLVDFVLAPFEAEEEPALRESLSRAEEAVLLWASRGLAAAMNVYNVKPRDAAPDPEGAPGAEERKTTREGER